MGRGNLTQMADNLKNGTAGKGIRRLGLKYCGGCNPRYDRIALAESLKSRLGAGVEWVSLEADPPDLVLAIEGCETACADLSPFKGVETRIITCPQDAEAFLLETGWA